MEHDLIEQATLLSIRNAIADIVVGIVVYTKFNSECEQAPLHAWCHIKLPLEIMLKRAVINVQIADNACFTWSVVAVLHSTQGNAHRESSYLHYTSVLNNLISWTSNFRWRQIKKFENINDISINIYINEKRIVDTIRRLKKEQTRDSYT